MPFAFHAICLAYWFVVGAVIGSFLNVCIYRIPNKESIVKGASHCTTCGEKITKRDLVPIISYFVLRGRCRSCKAPFSIRYALVEFLTGILFVLCALKFKYTAETILMSLFLGALIVMTFIDIDTMTIPDSIHIVILIIGIVLAFVSDMPLLERIIGFFSVSFILFLASVLSKGGIGGGDIKLMAVSGFVLGYKLSVVGFFIGAVLASIFGIVVSKGKRENLKSKIPLGPFLAVGMTVSIFVGKYIVDWYLGLVL